jgi:hypothetical protein
VRVHFLWGKSDSPLRLHLSMLTKW